MTGGSVDLLRQVTSGGKPADIVASADYVDIDNFLKPAGVATCNIVFAHGRMVLAYTESGVGPAGKNLPPIVDPAGPAFNPPNDIPTVMDTWYQTLLTPGVVVGGSRLGIPGSDPSVDVQATRTAWGLAILKSAPNRESAIKFLQLLLAPGDIGQATLEKVGPAPISPALVSADDFAQLPAELRSLPTSGDPLGA